MLATAAAEPTTLAIGIDADAASMAEASRRAARPERRGGLPNARFIVAAVELLPVELASLAGSVTVQLPWGSLLSGCLGGRPDVAAGIAGLVAPGGILELLLAPAPRDRLAELPTDTDAIRNAVARAFGPHGLRVVEAHPVTGDELRASHSTWAKRLLATGGAGRAAIRLRLRS